MNDNLIVSEVAATLSASPYTTLVTAVPNILHAQAAAPTDRPLLTVSGDFKEYRSIIRKGILSLELRSRVGDETEETPNHQSRFSLLFAAFLGAQGANAAATQAAREAAITAFKTAIAARGKITVDMIAPAETAVEATVEGDDLVTTLHLHFIARFVPQV